MTEIGSTVRIIAEFHGLVDAQVVAENEEGIVLRIDPNTFAGMTVKADGGPKLIKVYYGEVPDPDDPNLAWINRIHYNTLLEAK